MWTVFITQNHVLCVSVVSTAVKADISAVETAVKRHYVIIRCSSLRVVLGLRWQRRRRKSLVTLARCHCSADSQTHDLCLNKCAIQIYVLITYCLDWIGLSSVLRPRQHSIGYIGDSFTGQKTKPTASKYWRRCYKRQSKQRKQLNTHMHRQ